MDILIRTNNRGNPSGRPITQMDVDTARGLIGKRFFFKVDADTSLMARNSAWKVLGLFIGEDGEWRLVTDCPSKKSGIGDAVWCPRLAVIIEMTPENTPIRFGSRA